ncbi:MAG: helix-turn-helix domain-containing protein [Gemmatimonadaceae bacterium]
MNDPNTLLDIAAAAAFLNVSETSLRRWTNSGRLACLRVGLKRERRFRRADLLAFMEEEPCADVSASGVSKRVGPDGIVPNRGLHRCGVYETPLGRMTLAIPFLLEGLRFPVNTLCTYDARNVGCGNSRRAKGSSGHWPLFSR